MSGAGRGTPRVSPVNGTIIVPTGGGNITPVSSELFKYVDNESESTVLQAGSGETNVGDRTIPLESTRVQIVLVYQAVGPGNQALIRVYFDNDLNRPLIWPEGSPNIVGSVARYGTKSIGYLTEVAAGAGPYRFAFSPYLPPTSSGIITVTAAEIGDPGNPGTIDFAGIFADNLQPSVGPSYPM